MEFYTLINLGLDLLLFGQFNEMTKSGSNWLHKIDKCFFVVRRAPP
jgi:hypothetical protein